MSELPVIALREIELDHENSLALVLPFPTLAGASADIARREATRAVLRSVIGKLAARPAESFRFELGAEGKPCLVGGSDIAFNLSHSRGYSLIALSLSGEIGCDIENRFTGEDVSAVGPLILHPQELEAMERLTASDRQEAFRRYWVRKEAVLKAAGSGFLADPRHLLVGQEDSHAKRDTQPAHPFTIHNRQIEMGCVAAVASMDPVCIWHLLST